MGTRSLILFYGLVLSFTINFWLCIIWFFIYIFDKNTNKIENIEQCAAFALLIVLLFNLLFGFNKK